MLFRSDESDPTGEEYSKKLNLLSKNTRVKIKLIVNNNKNTVQAINAIKSHIDSDLIFIISDDTDCFNNWDEIVLKSIDKNESNFVIKTSDGINHDLITMPIFSKDYLDSKDTTDAFFRHGGLHRFDGTTDSQTSPTNAPKTYSQEELDKLQTVQRDSANDLKKSSDSFKDIVQKAEAYTDSAVKLENLLADFKSQYSLMFEAQESLAKVLTEMKSVEPSFSAKLDDLTQTFKNSTNSVADETKKQIQNIGEMLSRTIPELQNKINEQIANTNDQLKKNFETLDKNLEAELEKALVGLGQQLASLSEKFVQDYTPLTDRLREVVNISKGV